MLPINQIIHNIQFKCLFSLIHCPPVNSRKAAKHLNDMQKEAREMKSHCNVFLRLSDEKLAAHNRAKHEKKKGGLSKSRGLPTTYAKPMGVSAGEQKSTQYNTQ